MTNSELGNSEEKLLLSEHEYGAVDSWEWRAAIERVQDGWRARMELVSWMSGDEIEEQCYELSPVESGTQLFEFLESSWLDNHEEGLEEEQWLEIAEELDDADPVLGEEFRQAIAEEFSLEPAEASTDERLLNDLVRRATYTKTERGGGGAMWATIADSLLARSAIAHFCENYRLKYGRFPTGTHRVTVSFGEVGSGADLPPPQTTGFTVSGESRFDKDVTFPDE